METTLTVDAVHFGDEHHHDDEPSDRRGGGRTVASPPARAIRRFISFNIDAIVDSAARRGVHRGEGLSALEASPPSRDKNDGRVMQFLRGVYRYMR